MVYVYQNKEVFDLLTFVRRWIDFSRMMEVEMNIKQTVARAHVGVCSRERIDDSAVAMI